MFGSLVLFVVAQGAMQATPEPALDGTYSVKIVVPGPPRIEWPDPKTTPIGQIKRFLVQGKQCALMDMMVGFQGTLKRVRNRVEVTWYEGPSGKLKEKETLVFEITSPKPLTLTSINNSLKDKSYMVLVRTSHKTPLKLPY